MKAGQIITLIIFGAIVGVGLYSLYYGHARIHRVEKQLDSLRRDKKNMVKFDSIQSASQNRFLDSLSSIKTRFEHEKLQRTSEIKLLRKRNQDLENRFNSLVTPERPRFFQPVSIETGTIRLDQN